MSFDFDETKARKVNFCFVSLYLAMLLAQVLIALGVGVTSGWWWALVAWVVIATLNKTTGIFVRLEKSRTRRLRACASPGLLYLHDIHKAFGAK